MGLRAPRPKPGDLQNPIPQPTITDIPVPNIPQAKGSDELDDLEKQLQQEVAPQPAPDATQNLSAATLEQLESQLADETGISPELRQQIEQAAPLDVNAPGAGETGDIRELWTRFLAASGQNPEEMAQPFQRAFGEKNVKIQNGKLWFRTRADQKFRPVDDDDFTFFGDMIADLLPEIPSFAASIAVEAPFIAAAPFAGPAAPVVKGLGVAAGGGAAELVRRGQKKALGIEPTSEAEEDLLFGAGANLAGAGIFKLGSFGVNIVRSFTRTLPPQKIARLGELRDAMNQVLLDAGLKQSSEAELGQQLVGKRFSKVGERKGALMQVDRQLSNDISLVMDEAADLLGNGKIKLDAELDQMRALLLNNGFELAPGGKVIRRASKDTGIVGPRGEPISKTVAEVEDLGPEGRVRFETTKAPFSEANLGELNKAQAIYNSLVEANNDGGLDIRSLDRNVRLFQDLGEFNEKNPISDQLRDFYRKSSGALSDKRLSVLEEVFEQAGTEEASFARQVYENAAQKREGVRAFLKEFNSSRDPALFASRLVRKNQPEVVEQMRDVLGDGSEEMKIIRGNWISGLINKHVDTDGLLNPKGFLLELRDYGDDVVNQMLDERTQAELKFVVNKIAKISTRNISRLEPEDTGILERGIRTLFGNSLARNQAQLGFVDRVMYKILGGNAGLADKMANETFINLARQSATKQEAKNWILARNKLQRMLKFSKRIPGKNGKPDRYVPLPVLRTALVQLEKNMDAIPVVGSVIEAGGSIANQFAGSMFGSTSPAQNIRETLTPEQRLNLLNEDLPSIRR